MDGTPSLPHLGRPRREPVGALRLGTPASTDAHGWEPGRAIRHTIGWFDYDALNDPAEMLDSESGAEGAGAQAPLSEAADLLRKLAAALQAPLAALSPSAGVLQWPAPLLPYQREGVMALLSRRALLLADAMGLGKTIQAIAAIRVLYQQGQLASALVVCPASLVTQWRRELARWAPELAVVPIVGGPAERGHLWQLPAHVKLVSYDTLRADVLDVRHSPALRAPWGVVVLDEASRIKNPRAAVSVACRRVPRDRRWALTGTPVENRVEDAAAILDFLLLDAGERAPAASAAPREIVSLLRANQLRRRKEDVLPELPPKRIVEVDLELPPGQRAAYDRAEQDGIVQLTAAAGSVTVVHVLELIARLKQLCNYDPASGESAKLADIAERMRELVAEGQRALVFSQFTDPTFGIARAAEALRAFDPLVYTGAMTAAQRAAVIEQFVGEPRHRALLLSLRAGGQGLNLQAASYVFHLDRWWNPAIEEQADSRAHRIGQAYPVTVYRYTCAATIEERIAATLREKRRMFAETMEDASLDIASVLNEAELFGLFGLSGPDRMGRGGR